MNKKLLTLAIGAALSAGAVVTAQAGTTLYGHFHVSADRYDNGVTELSVIANNSSRFGIKGDEDLGGGMKAIYQVESGIFNVDDGVGGFGATLRNTFVGLSGAWGAVKIGRHDTPLKDISRAVDRFNEQVGDARNLVGANLAAGNIGNMDARVNNMVRYESPKIAGGLTFNALHTSDDGAELLGNASHKHSSANAIWSQGPVWAAVAYSERGNAGTGEDTKDVRAVGRFDFGMGDVGAFYEQMSDLAGVSGRDQDVYGVFGSVKIGGATRVKAQYYKAKDVDGTAAVDGGKLMAVGLDHDLGKKTKVYVNYAKTTNDSGTIYNVASSPGGHGDLLPAASGNDAKVASVGLIVDF